MGVLSQYWSRFLTFVTGRDDLPAFRGIRLRLTLWYGGVLCAALLLFGIALYTGMQHALLSPIDESLQVGTQPLVQRWQVFPQDPCDGPAFDFQQSPLWVCYDTKGNVIRESQLAHLIPGWDSPSLVSSALHSGTAIDTIDSHTQLGRFRRYAVAIPGPGSSELGVVQIGAQIGGQLDALHILITRLWQLGILTLLLTALGGLFLAGRALVPARRAYARQREFIADASHELRTPLTMLRADAEVLLRSRNRMDSDDVDLLEDVVAETSHMSALANNMLNLARLDAGDVPIEQDVVDLATVATEIGHRTRPLAQEHGVSIRLDRTEPVLVVGDRLLLEQATLILIDNAIKYNRPGGEVIIRVSTDADHALLEVRDTGIGITPEHLPHLGERFYRVDKARSREAGGAGLGVSIARTIAVRHHGSLQLASEQDSGTKATLALPLTRTLVRATSATG
jgi:signal transduction histidine kinase